ncbi:MAG: hypothetical protein CBB96_05465 [Gammaproteobacteria bacterium TMED36]|nr:MAG: hypothetical protein CBB96_09015 [Gammaproteobacteria bacterium TMED36]OUT94612.1 MAG: hypothetical protein CBB96_05465 [Gammaproteobacteria bacterium TMED36]|tara:strand:- start:764 stop:2467 length:1704 start_codon:yes stop_codon:yes gene_type:complete
MIVFKKIKYKNFLSTGNNFIEIDLSKDKSTLIVGQNGSGKSTMLDAISFALFGRAHRNISKNQLINSINSKDMLVHIEFDVQGIPYRIARGVKPGVFEIWKNNIMLNQSSHAREYQKILEQNILKLNHKSFHQVVVLGSSSFIPFMQLPAGHRRDVIEDLLDIGVFSKMSQILKEKNSRLRDETKENDAQLEILKNKIEVQKKYIRDITSISADAKKKKLKNIKRIEDEIQSLLSENMVLLDAISKDDPTTQQASKDLNDKKQSLMQHKYRFEEKHKALEKDSDFYKVNDICPTCTQEIDKELKDEKLKSLKDEGLKILDAVKGVKIEYTQVEKELDVIVEKINDIREKQSTINSNSKTIDKLQKQINVDKNEEDTSKDLSQANSELQQYKESQESKLEHKFALRETSSYNQVILEMLKDTGIKTKIIKQYLPVINKLVNQYLQILDFYVHFNLDESFQETIRSRHRDAFTYDSFSEGEKQRIDLALLFTWRQIAKMKNSVSTNLLILDETFDSSLDHDGIDNLMKILESLDDNTNTFVISHKGEVLDGKFNSKIEFVKNKNFSEMK